MKGKVFYKVRWEGYGAKDDQWVDEEDANEALREFMNSNPVPRKHRRKRR